MIYQSQLWRIGSGTLLYKDEQPQEDDYTGDVLINNVPVPTVSENRKWYLSITVDRTR